MKQDLLIQELLAQGRIEPLDIMLAQRIHPHKGCWLGIAVSASFRKGYTVVYPERVMPEELFMSQDLEALSHDMAHYIAEQIIGEYRHHWWEGLIECEDGCSLPYAYGVEQALARHIMRLASATPCVECSFSGQSSLHPEQYTCVQEVSKTTFSLITGGPGTGKTYTAAMIVASLPDHCHVGLFAPTGRAVQNMQAAFTSALPHHQYVIDAKTLHAVIRSKSQQLPYHMIIIDEASMVDSALLLQVLSRVHTGTRIVLLGDPYQLPPLDPGQPFVDMIAYGIPTFPLHTCHRTNNEELQRLFTAVKEQDRSFFNDWFASPQFIHIDASTSVQHYIDRASRWHQVHSKEEGFLAIKQSIWLTPTRTGLYGSHTVRPSGNTPRFSPIVVTKNHYGLGVMNGDLGLIEHNSTLPLLHFSACSIYADISPPFDSGYGITIHKSQGSEFTHVSCLLPPQGTVSRALLYTAITRARQSVQVVTSPEALLRALDTTEKRETLLPHFLKSIRKIP